MDQVADGYFTLNAEHWISYAGAPMYPFHAAGREQLIPLFMRFIW